MYLDRIEVSFDAGHRLVNYVGKCASPHGHTYKAEVFIEVERLDPCGLAVDFGLIKSTVKSWIDREWDHGFLLNDQDAALIEAFKQLPEGKMFLFEDKNPTAEVMAEELFRQTSRFLGPSVQRVRIWESPMQYAEFRDHLHARRAQ